MVDAVSRWSLLLVLMLLWLLLLVLMLLFAAMVTAIMVDAFWMLFFRGCFAGWSSQLNGGVFCHWLSLKDA